MNELLDIEVYEKQLLREEKAGNTISRYISTMKEFLELVGQAFTMEELKAYKELLEECQKPTTVNNKLMTINNLIKRSGIEDIKIKLLDVRKNFFITEGAKRFLINA